MKNLKRTTMYIARVNLWQYVCCLMVLAKHIALYLFFATALLSCKAKHADVVHSQPKDTAVYNIFKLENFFSYPVSNRKPIIIDSGMPETDKKIYNLRLQHWFLIYNTKNYVKKYGPLPKFYPENKTLAEYKANPIKPPDEYDKIMFGE